MRGRLWQQAARNRFNESQLWSILKLYQSSLCYWNDSQSCNATDSNHRGFRN